MPKSSKEIEQILKNDPKLARQLKQLQEQKRIDEKSRSLRGKIKELINERRAREAEDEDEERVDPKKFSIVKAVKQEKLYKISNRDKLARLALEKYKKEHENKALTSKTNIVPGQLVMFKYLNPKTKEELEYYDAAPCTIFFGIFNSKQGKRVLGFNVHYFPPLIRYNIMDKIYEMYRPVYSKYFETGTPKELDAFDYHYLTDELERHNLTFAVREYIPNLIGDTYVVPPVKWPLALLTEGWFKKETRATIMAYFKGDSKAKKKISTGAHSKGKAGKKKRK